MADQDQQDFDEFDTLVDDTIDPADDLSFDKPDDSRKKRQAVFYVVLLAFIALVGTSVWFVFLRTPEVSMQATPVAEADPSATPGDLPPGVLPAEQVAGTATAPAAEPVIDPVTGQPVAPQDGASIMPIDPSSVNPEVATPQVASPEVAAVENAASPSATVTSTGTTVEALPPPIATDAPADTADAAPVEQAPSDAAVVPAAPDATAGAASIAPVAQQPALQPVAETPAAVAPVASPEAAVAPVANPAVDQRLSQIEEQVKSIAAGAGTGASPELAAQLKSLSEKLDSLTTQVESLDQRTTNFATELQNRSNDSSSSAQTSEPKPVKKAAPKPVRKAAPKKAAPAASSTWELRSAQPGVAWLGRPGSGEMNRYAIGQSVPGLGTVQDVSQENGRWVVKTSGGTLRQ